MLPSYNSMSLTGKHLDQLYVMNIVYNLIPALTASNVLISPLLLLLQSILKPVCILGVKSNSMPVEMRQPIVKPLSKKIYQKKVDSLFKPVTLVNRHGTVEHDGFVFDIDIKDYNPDTFEGKTTISVKNNSGNEVQKIISDKFLFNDHIALGFEDYNFDGVDDIYVYNGQNGSYSTQTYEYYLFDKKAGNYQYSDELTSLTTRIGMKVDRKNKRLLIYSRGSCCNHTVQAYRYTDNHYTEFKRMEDFDEDTRYKVVIEELVGNKWMKTEKNYEGRKSIDKAIDYWRKKF